MKQAHYLLVIIINVVGFSTYAQNISDSYRFGNSLYETKEFSNAIEVYKRVLFFDTDGEYGPKVYKKIADCFYETEAYKDAANYYELAYYVEPNDSIKIELILQKASCYLLNKDYSAAQEELFSLDEDLDTSQLLKQNFYEGMVFFAMEDFDQAEVKFKKVAKDTIQIHKLFRENERVSKISPRKAKIFSMVLPGLGQFYAGDIKNGLNSMLLTSGLFYLGLRSAINTSLLDAMISVMPWFQRYYTGGFNKAESIAIMKKQQKRHKVFNELLAEVEE